jgi:tetratricopeptide (TPR) repeat protein
MLLTMVLFTLACAGLGGGDREASDEERASYDAALAEARLDPADGAAQLEAFIDTHPESALADDAAEQLARLALEQGDEARARDWLALILREYPSEDRADVARLTLARLELETGDAETARRLLSRAHLSRLEPGDRRVACQLMGQLAEEEVERFVWLARERGALAETLEQTVDEEQLVLFEVELGELDAALDELIQELPDVELELAAQTLDEKIPPPGPAHSRSGRHRRRQRLPRSRRRPRSERRRPGLPRRAGRVDRAAFRDGRGG